MPNETTISKIVAVDGTVCKLKDHRLIIGSDTTKFLRNDGTWAVPAGGSGKADLAVIAPSYNPPHNEGSLCSKDDKIYEALQDIPAGEAWTASHWIEVTVAYEITTIKQDLTQKQDDISYSTVTLTSSGWSNGSQTVNVSDVTASNLVLTGYAPASRQVWLDSGIYCSGQASGQLTFTCETAPSSNVTAVIAIID